VTEVERGVRAVIQAQCAAWNDGDLEGFVAQVGRDVVYVTGGGLVQGREALLEAYRGDWRDKGGQLTVEIERIIDHGSAATAIVQFWLSGSRADRSGWSLLTFAHQEGRWELIADATLRAPSR
jgi:uncharacterized protein (TIGR02246 family)